MKEICSNGEVPEITCECFEVRRKFQSVSCSQRLPPSTSKAPDPCMQLLPWTLCVVSGRKGMVVSTDQIVHLLCRHLSLLAKSQHRGLTSTSTKIISCTLSLSLQEIFEQKLFRQASKICCAAVHVLHSEYESLPSGKRYKIPKCELNRSKYSFVPLSIKTTKPVVLGSASRPDSTQLNQLPVTCMSSCCSGLCIACVRMT